MKKLILAITIIFTFGLFNSQAQNVKIAHLDYQAVMDTMPTFKIAQKKEKDAFEIAQTSINTLQTEIDTKYQIYMSSADTLPDILRQMREKEITDLQSAMQYVEQQYQNDVGIIGERYYTPLEDWFKQAVEIVGKRNGIAYILYENESLPIFWVNDDKAIDVTNQIITEMLRLEKENPLPY